MIDTEKSGLVEEIKELAERFGYERESLLPIMQQVQNRHGFVSEHSQQVIADVLGIHPVEVFGALSFYSFLSTKKKGRNVVRVCRTISCDLAGKDAIVKALEMELGIKFGESTEDEKFSLEYINCMGMCDQGPAMMINDKVYTRLTPRKVVEIIKNIK